MVVCPVSTENPQFFSFLHQLLFGSTASSPSCRMLQHVLHPLTKSSAPVFSAFLRLRSSSASPSTSAQQEHGSSVWLLLGCTWQVGGCVGMLWCFILPITMWSKSSGAITDSQISQDFCKHVQKPQWPKHANAHSCSWVISCVCVSRSLLVWSWVHSWLTFC